MKTLQRYTPAERARVTASSNSQTRQAIQVSPASAAIAGSPYMRSLSQARRSAVSPTVSTVQLQRDAEKMPMEEDTATEGVMQRVATAEETPNTTGMPNHITSGIEVLSGMDLSDVLVHRNSYKPAQLNALAYALGNEIHLGPGQERHLGHEAWHVVQQRQGRVRATATATQRAGVGVNNDVGLEREADLMGAKAEGGPTKLVQDGKKHGRTLGGTTSMPAFGMDVVDGGQIARHGSPSMRPSGRVIQCYAYINTNPPAEKEAQIYGIYETPVGGADNPKYVGQTTMDRAGTRFQEHVNNDVGAPWHGGDYSSDDDDDWPYVPRQIEQLPSATRFEVTVDEQYWYEDKGGKADLYSTNGGDAAQPMRRTTFNNYKFIVGNYDPGSIGLDVNWEPTDN